MTKSQKITLSASRDIPFNKLVLSQSNVRRVKAGVSIDELAEELSRLPGTRLVLVGEGPDPGLRVAETGVLDQARALKDAQVVARGAGVARELAGQLRGGRAAVQPQVRDDPGAKGVSEQPPGLVGLRGRMLHGLHNSCAMSPCQAPALSCRPAATRSGVGP